jgi:acyl-CoA synthetase (AMP-forming)/AMP-acid ligase II
MNSPAPDVVTAILAHADERPTAAAVLDADGTVTTYGELGRGVRAVRHGLLAEGFVHGDTVLFAARTGAAGLAALLGVLAAGGVVVTTDSGVGPALAAARLRMAPPRWLFAESALYLTSRFGPARWLARRRGLLLPDLRQPIGDRDVRKVYLGRWLPGVPRQARPLADLCRGPAPQRPDTAVAAAADPALVVFTSGTTQRPKGVVHTRGSIAAMMAMLTREFALGPGDVMHTDGLAQGLPALTAGATWSVQRPGIAPELFVRQLADRNVTHVYGVPVHLARIMRAVPRWPDGIRFVLMGSAPAAPAILRQALAAAPRADVCSVYAMTEAIPIAVVRAREKLAYLAAGNPGDLLGRPVDGVTARISSDGELVVAGPNLCDHYLGEEPHAVVRTGDLARFDDQGRLVMSGRRKDMIIRGSFNIYPALYEPAIAQLDGVREAALVGIADPVTEDETVVLAVVPERTTGPAALERRLRRALPDMMDAEAVPDHIVTLPDLPRGGRSDKLDRARLREQLTATAGGRR